MKYFNKRIYIYRILITNTRGIRNKYKGRITRFTRVTGGEEDTISGLQKIRHFGGV